MSIGSSVREIADVLDEFEDAGFEIVEPRSRDREGSVAVVFGAVVPALDGVEPGDAVEVSLDGASVDGDDRVVLDVSVSASVDETTETESGGSEAAADDASDTDEGDGRSDAGEPADRLPAHRDPEKLRAAYDAHDTFADMRDALGVDVTAQTVRRQMIEHGIHEPGSRDTGSDDRTSPDAEADDHPDGEDAANGDDDGHEGENGDAEDEDPGDEPFDEAGERTERSATLADGIDLPAGTDLDDLKRAVRSSRTVYEVSRSLGTERELTRRLLSELDLLDLVTGRLSEERQITAEEIDRRVEQSAPRSA